MPEFDVVETMPDEQLVLPLKGADGTTRRYTIEPVAAEWWWKFAALKQVLTDVDLGQMSTEKDEDLASTLNELGAVGLKSVCLGIDNVKQMLADGVSGPDMQRAVNTTFAWHAGGGDQDAAKRAWSGKALMKALDSTTSSSTDPASSTKRPASGRPTTSRRSSKGGSVAAAASPGSRSSTTST